MREKIISSRENSIFNELLKLKEKKHRKLKSTYLVEGIKIAKEAIKLKVVKNIIISESFQNYHSVLEGYEGDLIILTDKLFREIVDTVNSQGIISEIFMNEIRNISENNFVLYIDKVQDPGNIGTIIRTAEAVGIKDIILKKGTVDIYSDKVLRSTMGSILRMNFINDDDYSLLQNLKENGYEIIISSLEDSENLFDAKIINKKVLIVIGNESAGVSEEIYNLADRKIKIPMYGESESLNVAVATGIILYEFKRKFIGSEKF